MKNLFMFAAVFGLLAAQAQAQTTYPGQMAVVGTMTVQGNAFSVGGSTFSVLAGTINAGVLLKVSAAGIQWADGKVSTTSGGGGTGNANLSANQTFTGQNTFTGAVSVTGAASYITAGSSITTSGGLFGKSLAIGTTFTADTNGIISAPSQAAVSLTQTGPQLIPQNSATELYIGLNVQHQNMFDATNSSSTVTLPVLGGYRVMCNICFAPSATASFGGVFIRVNSTDAYFRQTRSSTTDDTCTQSEITDQFAAGTTFKCRAYTNGVGGVNAISYMLSVLKVW